MERVIFFVGFFALSVAGSLAHAQGAGGLALAQRVCSECHAIRKGGGSLAELTVTDVFGARRHPGNDEHCLDGGAYDAPCGDADVHAHRRAERRHNCLHPRPALADLITTARSRTNHCRRLNAEWQVQVCAENPTAYFKDRGIGQDSDYPRRPSGFLKGRRSRRPSRSRGARTMNCRGRPRSIASENACAGAAK
jgi:hypothetical protein